MQQITDPVDRARHAADSRASQYGLGCGGYHPERDAAGALVRDEPYGPRDKDGLVGVDCSSFAEKWCHRIPGHLPGFNRDVPGARRLGPSATVVDDLNTDSTVEDAWYRSTLFSVVNGWHPPGTFVRGEVKPGDLLVYRSIYRDGQRVWPWIGHVSIVLEIMPGFDPAAPRWELLLVAQAKGGDGRKPAVIVTDGSIWVHHDELWQATDADRRDYPERAALVVRVDPVAAAKLRGAP